MSDSLGSSRVAGEEECINEYTFKYHLPEPTQKYVLTCSRASPEANGGGLGFALNCLSVSQTKDTWAVCQSPLGISSHLLFNPERRIGSLGFAFSNTAINPIGGRFHLFWLYNPENRKRLEDLR